MVLMELRSIGWGGSIWCWDLHMLGGWWSPVCIVLRLSKVAVWLGGVPPTCVQTRGRPAFVNRGVDAAGRGRAQAN